MAEAKKNEEQKPQEDGRQFATPRGPAATAAKNKYRDKNYDRAELALPKGMKASVREIAKRQGQSFNEYVTGAIKEKVERDTGEELTWGKQ